MFSQTVGHKLLRTIFKNSLKYKPSCIYAQVWQVSKSGTFYELLRGCTWIAYCRCREAEKLFTFLLPLYSLIPLMHSFRIPSSPQAFLNFNKFANLCLSQGLAFPKIQAELGLQSPPVAHSFRHTGHEVWTGFLNNLQSLWISDLDYMNIVNGTWTAFGPFLFIIDFAVGYRTWSVTSVPYFRFLLYECLSTGNPSNGLSIQLTALLYALSQVIFNNFLNICLRSNRLWKPGISLFRLESVVDSPYAVATEAVN
jgi:hypothetical protein